MKNVGITIGGFIGKAVTIIRNVGNIMSYLPGSLGKIGQTINHVAGGIDSFTGMLPSEVRDKVEKDIGKGSTSGNMNPAMNVIKRSDNSNITAAHHNAMQNYHIWRLIWDNILLGLFLELKWIFI
ncbi:MAG: hypothetical protein Ta2E_01910 [Mycoplasmoidaceae bacterium]|nr:MAG: hypothetical protein Ta2E_01910 [Mycoplasmoidaceae bacterium]